MATENFEFSEIRKLLQDCGQAYFEDVPIASEKGQWELFRGHYRVHTDRHPFEILYLLSDITKEAVARAKQVAFSPSKTIVVYAPSLESSGMQSHRAAFQADAKHFWTAKEYLRSFMEAELSSYRSGLASLSPTDFVEPHIEVPAGVVKKIPNPLLNLLTAPSSGGVNRSNVAVLLAEAGHGKTYITQYVVGVLAERFRDITPFYVNSEQWASLSPDELSSIDLTVSHSLRSRGCSIPWMMGREEQFIRVALRLGLFVIVFDGFDEYVLNDRDRRPALDVLAKIESLAEDTGARVLLTSRTAFWRSEVAETPQEHRTVLEYRLEPFDTNQARNYFGARLPGRDASVRAAVRAFDALVQVSPELAGRGFVLSLLADLADDPAELMEPEGIAPLQWIMEKLCERDQRRQNLPLTAAQQLRILERYAFEKATGEIPDSTLLKYEIQIELPELSDAALKSILERMRAHALIQLGGGDRWFIKHEQVEMALVGQYLMDVLLNGDEARDLELELFNGKCRLGDAALSDVSAAIAQHCLTGNDEAGDVRVRALIARIARVSEQDSGRGKALAQIGGQVALRVAEKRFSQGTQKRERTNYFLSLFPNGHPESLTFSGSVSRFDLRGVKIVRCCLSNVRWVNCDFDDNSRFINCVVLGGIETRNDGIEMSQWEACEYDETGKAFVDSLRIRGGKKRYDVDRLRYDLTALVEKFVGKGGQGFKSVAADDIGKGKIATSPKKKEIVDEFTSSLLTEHTISQTGRGYALDKRAHESVRFFVTNNVFVGPLKALFDKLSGKLCE